jgi:hypothetical protein
MFQTPLLCLGDLLTGRWWQLGHEIEQMRLLTDADHQRQPSAIEHPKYVFGKSF